MKQEVDIVYNKVCSACLSSDRDLVFIIGQSDIYQIFRLLIYDFVGDKNTDHTYSFSQSLSTLGPTIKNYYDLCYDNTNTIQTEWTPKIVAVSFGSNVKNRLNNDEQMLESMQMLEDPNTIVKRQILIKQEPINLEEHREDDDKTVLPKVTISIGPPPEDRTDLSPVEDVQSNYYTEEKPDLKAGSMEYMNDENTLAISIGSLPGDKADASKDPVEEKPDWNLYSSFEMNPYITEYMNDEAMLAFREKAKEKVQYASAAYKCDLCIIDFGSQQQVDEHCKLVHKARAGTKVCKICLVYIEQERMSYHMQSHYVRHVCRLCGHTEATTRLAQVHAQQHLAKKPPSAFIKKDLKKEMNEEDLLSNIPSANSETQVLTKLSKNAVVAFKCFECDMFFQTNNTRKAHMAKYHNASSLECDICNKVFANKYTLIRHLRLHEGPLPRKECPICQKLVRVIDLKYHVQRHQTKGRYECRDCKKVFSHISTYQGHLKYTRAHASDHVFKFQCPKCSKGYSTKKAMQDHFNYHHLGKTSHKCLICNKPMATKVCVERHMMRIHGEKKEKPRTHICEQCGKAFADKKILIQHEMTHSGARPLSCDICQQTFKHKASLYTHRKKVHNIALAKKVVEFMDTQNAGV